MTPDEFAKIQPKELKLPRGWIVGADLPKPAEEVELCNG
jgi:hypothetical protein